MKDVLKDLAYLYGQPQAKAKFKAANEDFVVKEVLGYEFTGEGEHLMLRVRKSGENTSFVANEIAKVCGVKSKDVGWAGLKDRHAVTEQWLSVHLPKKNLPDFAAFHVQYPSIEVLETAWHNKKLRPGDLAGNQFEVRLTDISDMGDLEHRLELVKQGGVPNYFGQQRFGRDGGNVEEARRWGRDNVRTRNQNKRSLYLSAARSWIFNHIVSKRIEAQSFDTKLAGDIVDEHGVITAALVGDNDLPTQQDALELEQSIVDLEPELMLLIRGNRMRHDRRQVVLKPESLTTHSEENTATLSFFLDSGSFATSILRELAIIEEVERQF
ncbi:tRNA pseudouridine(13) synthase TruD [Vibrio hangzhouensis]|uniref:tRNA pseudouridine(13) synthase TruD n=1 Tax=Vibrio hangzhouensis TaxID=462991 RepID=UPI001C977ADF|nr:tRNA pseudouridine(13) synthase TruD [Vibrio hangzhouensis]MBY6198596.1 tRNA pseudouridine(13) synthase TruD [Vibrio hangzhouensis]